jgi:hypothetical protein
MIIGSHAEATSNDGHASPNEYTRMLGPNDKPSMCKGIIIAGSYLLMH